MKDFDRIPYLLATDPTFRQAFALSPHEAVRERKLYLSVEEVETLVHLRGLRSTSSTTLGALLGSLNIPGNWGGLPPSIYADGQGL